MTTSTATIADVSGAVATILGAIPDLMVDWYVSDRSRPPVAIVGQPEIRWDDPDAGFCWATFLYPVTLVVSRSQDLQGQTDLSRYLGEVVVAFQSADVDGVGLFSIDPLDARPSVATIAGVDFPAYELTIRVRA